MTFIGYGIVCVLLLMFVRGTMASIYPIVQVVVFFVLLAEIYRTLLRPLFERLVTSFQMVPYSELLLYSAFLLVVTELVQVILVARDEAAIGQVVRFAVQLTLIWLWVEQLTPVVGQMADVLQRVR